VRVPEVRVSESDRGRLLGLFRDGPPSIVMLSTVEFPLSRNPGPIPGPLDPVALICPLRITTSLTHTIPP
jgi:hypothetical protein